MNQLEILTGKTAGKRLREWWKWRERNRKGLRRGGGLGGRVPGLTGGITRPTHRDAD